jgi:hypothetical protein
MQRKCVRGKRPDLPAFIMMVEILSLSSQLEKYCCERETLVLPGLVNTPNNAALQTRRIIRAAV